MDSRALAVVDRLRAQDREQRRLGLPTAERSRNVGAETARYLYLVARTARPRRVLEIGSSNGLSTIWLALGARDVDG